MIVNLKWVDTFYKDHPCRLGYIVKEMSDELVSLRGDVKFDHKGWLKENYPIYLEAKILVENADENIKDTYKRAVSSLEDSYHQIFEELHLKGEKQ